MQFVRDLAEVFAEFFSGHQGCYGVHIPQQGNVGEGEKAKGKSFTKTATVTLDNYLRHLHGEESIGIAPLRPDGKVNFGVIDIDEYPSNPGKYMTMLQRTGLPLVIFQSKSKGLHLYIFFKKAVKADEAVKALNEIRQLFGLPENTEVFPKQTRLVNGATGNWINLPYYNHEKTERYAFSKDLLPLDLADAIELIKASAVSLDEINLILKKIPLAQAPPCLQTIYVEGGADKGERNMFLFNCAVYLKARFGEDFGEQLHHLNKLMLDPVEYIELDRTVISSHNKREYTYQCKQGILKSYCSREQCKGREYGIESGEISNLSFEKLVQVKSTKPYYVWTVNGIKMTFYSESELMQQTKFRELCLRQLHTVPNRMTEKAWSEILNRALENLVIEDVDLTDDVATDSLWVEKVGEFFARQAAHRPDQVLQGLPWYSPNDKRLHFKGAKLLDVLSGIYAFREFPASRHRALLKGLGAVQTRLSLGKGKVTRTWAVNIAALQEKGYFLDVDIEAGDASDFTPLDFAEDDKF